MADTITDEALDLLRKLCLEEQIPYKHVSEEHKQQLRARLRALRALGLIETSESIARIVDKKTDGINIATKIRVTSAGRRYLTRREEEDFV